MQKSGLPPSKPFASLAQAPGLAHTPPPVGKNDPRVFSVMLALILSKADVEAPAHMFVKKRCVFFNSHFNAKLNQTGTGKEPRHLLKPQGHALVLPKLKQHQWRV